MALLFSTLIHAAIILLLWRRPPAVEPPQPIEIELRETAAPSKGGRKGAKGGKSRAGKISLSKLVPKLDLRPRETENWIDSEEEARDPRELGFGQGGDVLTRRQMSYGASLWQRIERHIEDNPFLSEYNHTGKVFLRFELDEHGSLVPGSLHASAPDRVLKVIAARAVRAALADDAGDVRPPPTRMRIYARFSWSSYQACNFLRGHNGNHLSFCHYAENKRRNFSAGERTGTWISAIAQHGPWAYEEIQKYNREERHRKDQFNPFRKYELDPDWNL